MTTPSTFHPYLSILLFAGWRGWLAAVLAVIGAGTVWSWTVDGIAWLCRTLASVRRASGRYVLGHDADPQGVVRRPLVQVLQATRVWLLLPGRVQGALCNCPLDRGMSERS